MSAVRVADLVGAGLTLALVAAVSVGAVLALRSQRRAAREVLEREQLRRALIVRRAFEEDGS